MDVFGGWEKFPATEYPEVGDPGSEYLENPEYRISNLGDWRWGFFIFKKKVVIKNYRVTQAVLSYIDKMTDLSWSELSPRASVVRKIQESFLKKIEKFKQFS